MISTVWNDTIIFTYLFQNDGDYQIDNDLIVESHGESCLCENMTVYSECNTGNSEFGIYQSIGEDASGRSVYESLADSNYQILYDVDSKVSKFWDLNINVFDEIILQKWLINNGSTILDSEITSSFCPSDMSTWTYLDGSVVKLL